MVVILQTFWKAFVNGNCCILIKIVLKCVCDGSIDSKSALIQVIDAGPVLIDFYDWTTVC